jgi:diguanylate cyclase (GGDEF)-like protein
MAPMPSTAPGLGARPVGRWLHDRLSVVAACFGAVGVVVAALYGVPGDWSAHVAALSFMAAATLVAMVAGQRLNAPPRRGPWEVLLLGVALVGTGGFLRLDRHTLGAVSAGRAFLPDLLVLAGSVVVTFAVTVLARAPHPHGRRNPDMVLQALVAGLSAYALIWVYLVEPAAPRLGLPTFERCVLPVAPSLDAFMVVVVLIGVLPRSGRSVAARALVAAVAALTVADLLYLVADVRRAAVPHSLLGVGYLLAASALGVCFLHPSMRRLFGGRWTPSADPSSARNRLLAVVLAPGVLAAIGLTDPARSADQRIVLGVLGAAAVLTAALAVWRAAKVGAVTQASLVHQVTHDPLTGLGNRVSVERAIAAALAGGARARDGVAVIFLDVDRFKLVNDAHGYSAGDQLLVDVGQRLLRVFGRRGAVARVAGDEFAVVLFPVASAAQARREADTAHDALQAPFSIYGSELLVSASVGVALSSGAEPTADPESMLRDADTAMYQAKAAGRDMVTLFDTSMRDRIADRLALEHDLRRAIERDEFRLMFQPIVTLDEGGPVVVGLEALLRWDRPTRGLVPASIFIECAEASGLLIEIGDWVIRESARRLAEWRRVAGAEALFVSVNVSTLHLRSHTLAARVRRVLAETGLTPDALCIEMSESTLMDNPAEGVGLLIRLKEIGVRLAVDDFGNGYSSLAYLKQFPVDYVKIDRSFIDGLVSEDETDATLVAAIVSMAGAIDAVTIAEGVEHERQEYALRALGCDLAQGFLYARPVAADDVIPTVRALSPRHGLRLVTGDGGGGRPKR